MSAMVSTIRSSGTAPFTFSRKLFANPTIMLRISETIEIPLTEIELTQIRASGPGGQNVNKVSSAIHLRFDIAASSLPDSCRERLLRLRDRRLSGDGCIVIKAQQFRSLEKNREDALQRLRALIVAALRENKRRKPTAPSRASRRKRLETKTQHGRLKELRKKVGPHD